MNEIVSKFVKVECKTCLRGPCMLKSVECKKCDHSYSNWQQNADLKLLNELVERGIKCSVDQEN